MAIIGLQNYEKEIKKIIGKDHVDTINDLALLVFYNIMVILPL